MSRRKPFTSLPQYFNYICYRQLELKEDAAVASLIPPPIFYSNGGVVFLKCGGKLEEIKVL